MKNIIILVFSCGATVQLTEQEFLGEPFPKIEAKDLCPLHTTKKTKKSRIIENAYYEQMEAAKLERSLRALKMSKNKDCNLKKIKEVGDEYKLTFDCGLKMPIKKELIAGLSEPKVGDKLCPEHNKVKPNKAIKPGKVAGIKISNTTSATISDVKFDPSKFEKFAGIGAGVGAGYLIDDPKIKKQIEDLKND